MRNVLIINMAQGYCPPEAPGSRWVYARGARDGPVNEGVSRAAGVWSRLPGCSGRWQRISGR
jgi:hypothetical protein